MGTKEEYHENTLGYIIPKKCRGIRQSPFGPISVDGTRKNLFRKGKSYFFPHILGKYDLTPHISKEKGLSETKSLLKEFRIFQAERFRKHILNKL